MRIAILIYNQMTALDAIGPYEVLSRLPGVQLCFVSERCGEVRTDTGALGLVADAEISDLDQSDMLLVPGGPGARQMCRNTDVLDWIRRIDASTRLTTSVCTGALILGSAGLLEGRRATTHWASMDELRRFGVKPVEERFVQDGKIWTAAGVSAGIDMALQLAATLAGEDYARALQLGMEYDPAPPFDAGSPRKAPAHVVELVRGALGASA